MSIARKILEIIPEPYRDLLVKFIFFAFLIGVLAGVFIAITIDK